MKIGGRVPELVGVDEKGGRLRLADLLADGPVVVFFYPAAMSRGCTKESCHFRDLAGEFAALGVNIVGVSADPVDKQAAFSTRHSLGFPLVADTDHVFAAAFGVRRQLGPNRRSTFVVDTDGTVLARIDSELSMSRHADAALDVLRTHAGQRPGGLPR